MSGIITRRGLLTGAAAGLGASLAGVDLAAALLPQQRAFLTSQAVDIIDVIAGQSNELYGVPFTAGVDVGQSNFFQMFTGYEGTANHVSNGGANDPLDNPDTTGIITPAIGNAVHFYRDYFCPVYGPRRVLFVPCAYGGTSIIQTGSGQWGIDTSTASHYVGSLTPSMIARVALARQLWPAAKLILRIEDVEQDFTALGTTFVPAKVNQFRGAWLSWICYVRAQFAALGFPSFPILIGRPTNSILTTYDSESGGFNWYPPNVVAADATMRALYNRVPNVGIADSQNPTNATNISGSAVHFDHAGQVTMAGRYFTAYRNAVGDTLYPTSPTWDATDYLTTAGGFASGFTVGTGGSSLSGDSTSAWKTAWATTPSQPSTSAKLYAEIPVTAVASGGNMIVGLSNQGYDFGSFLGQSVTNAVMGDYSAAGYFAGSTSLCSKGTYGAWVQTSFSCPAFAAADVMQFAVDRGAGKAWVGRNGTWLGSGNPATGANPWITSIPSTDMVFLAASIYTGTGNTFGAIKGTSSQFSYSPPSGFSPWGH